MAYDEKTLKRDGSGITPVPQHYNSDIDDFEVTQGSGNALWTQLRKEDGSPIDLGALIGEAQASPTANTLLARVKSLEDKLGEAEASPTANTLLARLKSLEDKIDAITDGTSPAVTQLSGSNLPLVASSAEIGKVKISSRNVVQYETLLNSASIAAGAFTDEISLNLTDESEIWILVNIDKQPWSLLGNFVNYGSIFNAAAFYPQRSSYATTAGNAAYPIISMFLGNAQTGLTPPATLVEAKNYISMPFSNAKVKVKNEHATDIATVSIKILRIWREK